MRWNHPSRGLIGPAEFIPIAEETGLISQFGDWVLRSACEQAKAWHGAGSPDLCVSVNVSPRQVHAGGFGNTISQVLKETGFPAHTLQIELTESVIMDTSEQVVQTLRHIADLGVRIAIDDFGTGYSSISYLRFLVVTGLHCHPGICVQPSAPLGGFREPLAPLLADPSRLPRGRRNHHPQTPRIEELT
jgi:EAL domain-containing protein (putative c-di-GMP-specific phosphodiesterase class I)